MGAVVGGIYAAGPQTSSHHQDSKCASTSDLIPSVVWATMARLCVNRAEQKTLRSISSLCDWPKVQAHVSYL